MAPLAWRHQRQRRIYYMTSQRWVDAATASAWCEEVMSPSRRGEVPREVRYDNVQQEGAKVV